LPLRTTAVAALTHVHRQCPRPGFGSSLASCRHSVSNETVPLAKPHRSLVTQTPNKFVGEQLKYKIPVQLRFPASMLNAHVTFILIYTDALATRDRNVITDILSRACLR
jgi:hypothetical protein